GLLGSRTWSAVTAEEIAMRGAGGSVEQFRQSPARTGSTTGLMRRVEFNSGGGSGGVSRQSPYGESLASPLQQPPHQQQRLHQQLAPSGASVLPSEWARPMTPPSPAVGGGGGGIAGAAAPAIVPLTAAAARAGGAIRSGSTSIAGGGGGGGGSSDSPEVEGDVGAGCSDEDALAILGANLSREVGIDEQLAALPETLGIGDLPLLAAAVPATTTTAGPLGIGASPGGGAGGASRTGGRGSSSTGRQESG
ncbi:hypothetical protein Vretifemale_11556, partial [Volvox reticuliferus]